ncbi:DNA ligase [Flagellatimonas centrodinii]|uniref:DNA ligase n=1 Tax=Flagellatimonas centrodinii TaxID=2806210 RepID=UPI001FEF662B|nr:DNA ligase [Flagellatimonas centrodinii]ULQ47836.1 DNA ligase [Flagellatimonas centrodinii]
MDRARRRLPHLLVSLLLVLLLPAARADPPALTRASVYDDHARLPIDQYWVSEKYDGVRGYWDGQRLYTRQGYPIDTPPWFTAGWPDDLPLDGELWIGRGRFAEVSGIVRTHPPTDDDWRRVQYRVFDLPDTAGPFDTRLQVLQQRLAALAIPWLQPVPQFRVADEVMLMARLEAVVDAGGEGLMLHHQAATYHTVRNHDLIKLKPYRDAEARVVAHHGGEGRLRGLMGAMTVETPEGRRFRIGSGFSDAERADPPAIGSWITYRYSGLTATGLPRFARFLRIRPEGPPPAPSADRSAPAGPQAPAATVDKRCGRECAIAD